VNRGDPVTVHFPDGWTREGWYARSGKTPWHRISSSITKGSPSTAGWWCVTRKQGQAPYFVELHP
jgi:hypothetical protein